MNTRTGEILDSLQLEEYIRTGEILNSLQLKKYTRTGEILDSSQLEKYKGKLPSHIKRMGIVPTEKQLMRGKIGRNELCGCGSDKKFKKCCLKEDKNG